MLRKLKIAILVAVAACAVFVGIALSRVQKFNPDHATVVNLTQESSPFRVNDKPYRMELLSYFSCRPIDTSSSPAKMLVDNGPHATAYVYVYVNKLARSAMWSGIETYPVGSRIVKQKFDADVKNVELYTTMQKMAAGYDSEHGDWQYGVVDAKGATLEQGRLQRCIDCHAAYKEADYVTRIYIDDRAAKKVNP